MSNVLKVNKSGKQNIKVLGIDGSSVAVAEDPMQQMQLQLHNAYERGTAEGYKKAVNELENKYQTQLQAKIDEINRYLSEFDEKLKSYDNKFNRITLELSFIIAEKIIGEEIQRNPLINKILSESMKKVLGANNVIIKLNEKDLANLNNESKNLLNDGSFSKIKFETDDSIEPGGCLIETDIGNVDGRIGAQLKELKKQLEQKVLLNDEDNGN